MNANTKAVIEECTKGSTEGWMPFPEVVKKLMEAGVERYRFDLCRGMKTYYMPDGDSMTMPSVKLADMPANRFDAESVVKALRAIQTQQIVYREFCELIAKAGCTEYLVSLPGQRAVYTGRTGEDYVERFPGAK